MYDVDDVERMFAPWFVGEVSDDGERRAYCPSCEDPGISTSPSASFNAEQGEWNCLKGNHGGQIVDLVQELRKEGKLSTNGGPAKTTPRRERSQSKPPTPISENLAQKATEDWPGLLMHSTRRLAYLTTQRGLTEETIERFQIGFDGERYTIPVGLHGEWVNVRRYSSSVQASNKMLNIEGHGTAVLAFTDVLASNSLPVLLCEGEFDAILANQEMAPLAVAVTGTGGAGTPPRDLSALAGRDVFIAYDLDDAGRTGAEKVAERLRKVGASAHILDLAQLGLKDKGADITDYFQKHSGTPGRLIAEMKRLRETGDVRQRFVRVSAAELAGPVPATQWLVRDVWTQGSYGVFGGAKKTLKTYNLLALVLAVASGEPFLGRFAVPRARPVIMYLSEGGDKGTRRRLQAIARYMGVDLASLPISMVFDAAPIGSELLAASIARDIADLDPGLVVLDALYAFHAQGVEVSNLYERGQMLYELQQMVVGPDRSLIVADHFSKMRKAELDLDAISQSGVAEWAQSWALAKHRTPPNVAAGEFRLAVQFGGRDGYGNDWAIDWHLGPLGADGTHGGPITVDVAYLSEGAGAAPQKAEDRIANDVLDVLRTQPYEFTRTEALEKVSGGSVEKREAFDRLIETNTVDSRRVERVGRDRKTRSVVVWGAENKRVLSAPNASAAIEPEPTETDAVLPAPKRSAAIGGDRPRTRRNPSRRKGSISADGSRR